MKGIISKIEIMPFFIKHKAKWQSLLAVVNIS